MDSDGLETILQTLNPLITKRVRVTMILRLASQITSAAFPRHLSTVSGSIVPPLAQTKFFKDTRIGKRTSCDKPLILKDGRVLRFEVADEKDEELVTNQYLEGFINKLSYMRALNATRNDYFDMFNEHIRILMPHRGTILGFYEDNLVCFRLASFYEHSKIPKTFGPMFKNGDPPPVFKFPNDFGALMETSSYKTLPPKFSSTILHLMEHQMGKFLPLDVKNLAYGEALFVHDEFMRKGIAEHVNAISYEIAKAKGCNYEVSINVTTSSTRLAEKHGSKTMFQVPYNKICINGDAKFKNLWDSVDFWSANLLKLN